MLNNLPRPPVYAVLQQHMDDASFACVNRQSDIWNPVFDNDDISQTHERIKAHLEGLQVAGKHAIKLAFELLEKWESDNEIFLCTYLLNQAEPSSENHQYYLTLVEYIEENEEFIEPASIALNWAPENSEFPITKFWWESTSNHLRAAAFNAMINYQIVDVSGVIHNALNDVSPLLKQRACRVVGEGSYTEFVSDLQKNVHEESPEVRFEAAIALTLLSSSSDDSWNSLIETLPLFEEHRLHRGIMIFAMFAPADLFQSWYLDHKGKPEQYRTLLWALAYRGDPQYLSLITRFIANDLEPKLAGYVFGHITGLDLTEEEFYLVEEIDEEDEEDSIEHEHSEDGGLVYPDSKKLTEWFNENESSFPQEGKFLDGQPISECAEEVLEQGYQIQRIQAAAYLTVLKKKNYLNDILFR